MARRCRHTYCSVPPWWFVCLGAKPLPDPEHRASLRVLVEDPPEGSWENMDASPSTRVWKPVASPAPGRGPAWTVVRFRLGTEVFALEAHCLREVVRAVAIAALPGAPRIVEGVIDFHGEIVPVLDIRTRFRLPANPLRPDQHFLVAVAGRRTVALRVDEALDVVRVDPGGVDARPQELTGLDHLKGVARRADGLVVIQDLERFLSLDEAAELDRALERSPDFAAEDGRAGDPPLP